MADELNHNPRLEIDEKSWKRIHRAAKKAGSKEVGMFALAEEDRNGVIKIWNPFLVKQTIASTEVDYEDDHQAEAVMRMLEQGIDSTLIRCTIHSHGNMSCFWSPTDEDAIRKYGRAGMPWMVSIVVNSNGEYRARFDVFNIPIVGKGYWDNLKINVFNPSVDEEWEEEYDKYVTEKVYKPYSYSGKGQGQKTTGYLGHTTELEEASGYPYSNWWDYQSTEMERAKARKEDREPIPITDLEKRVIRHFLPSLGIVETDLDDDDDWQDVMDVIYCDSDTSLEFEFWMQDEMDKYDEHQRELRGGEEVVIEGEVVSENFKEGQEH